jgi:hypothetical protein
MILKESIHRPTFDEFCITKFGMTTEERIEELIALTKPKDEDAERYRTVIAKGHRGDYAKHVAHIDYLNATNPDKSEPKAEDEFATQYKD